MNSFQFPRPSYAFLRQKNENRFLTAVTEVASLGKSADAALGNLGIIRVSMKIISALILALALQRADVTAAEQIVTLGDSLTFAYESGFGTGVTIPFVGSYGDGFGPGVRNWVEILGNPLYRKSRFDLGARRSFSVNLPFAGRLSLYLRQEYNWAVPGMKIDELWKFMNRQITVFSLLDPDLAAILALSNFDEDNDFAVEEMEDQIRNTAERLTLFIGGNDVRAVYGGIYQQNSAGTFVVDFVNYATLILDRVLSLNPDIQIVLVNVPHIGITPEVKGLYPPDMIKTQRVTDVLIDLNARLATLAASRNIGYADVFDLTLPLLGNRPLCIHGINFANGGSTSGDLNFVWLNGPLSRNFHPNTNAQALIANQIIAAFNERYQTAIAHLSATEILGGMHGKTTAQIDMPFATWMTRFGKTGLPISDDSDNDGISAAVEFALGLNPTIHDSDRVNLLQTGGSLELSYPIRLPISSRYTLVPALSTNLITPFIPIVPLPTLGPDGLARAVLPLTPGSGFMRLQATIP